MLISALPYIQIILSIFLVVSVLLQRSEAGVGGSFGGSDNWNSGFHTRRGFEKFLFNFTIVLAILFAVSSFASLLLQ
jgi:protein translocase SecG subunit